MIGFIGKSLLIEENGERVLVVSDLHLGYGESLRESGVFVPENIHAGMMKDFKEIFERVGRVDKIIILGDVKHEIGRILGDEWKEVRNLFGMLEEHCEEIVVIKGNHDALLGAMLKNRVELKEFYLWKDCAFLHGNKDYLEIYDKKIKNWFMGHIHPALNLREGVKEEKYKCFLDGKFKGRRVVVLPSFFSAAEGSDPRETRQETAWELNFERFNVWVVGDKLEVLDFGLLKDI